MSVSLGPVMIDVASTTLDNSDRALLEHPSVGGVVLFARNLESPEQCRALCDAIRVQRPDILISIDHEGGRVQRLREGLTSLPPMCAFGHRYPEEPQETLALVHECGWLMSQELSACGLDFSFAPVLDVDETLSKVIGERSFSPQPAQVSELAGALLDGFDEGGMASVGKHFPGHGGVEADSHLELPVDERSLEALKAHDLIPFADLATRLTAVMPSHVRYPAFDPNPTGFSAAWLDYLRHTLGFKGAILSDDLSMHGASFAGGPVERAQLALASGCDAVLVCNDRDAARAVLESVSPCRERAVRLERLRRAQPFSSLEQLQTLPRWQEAHDRLTALAAQYGY
ncbi:beta-N-acetylhexosaminidase [Carnimonas nigrificans]|uniref:beta-N-acetylhexosaminidase n=1 Tax=Carnimonas nigrificans TaxID=64323 RepID=UPI0004721E5A|nr:beta-N-acetylhexosaminidase [Carnimonas nigrificans]